MLVRRERWSTIAAPALLSVGLALLGVASTGCEDVEPAAPGTGGTSAPTVGGGGLGGTPATGGNGGETATAMGGGGTSTTVGSGGAGTTTTTTGEGGTGGAGGGMVAGIVPDFSLLDVNPASPTSGQAVSPRDHLTRVSAWYFGHST